MLRVVDPEVLTDAGLNEAAAPDGNPLTLNATVPVNPVPGVTVAPYVAPAPARTVEDAGVAESEKSVTVIVRVTGWLVAPPLSVTVNEAAYVPGVE